MADIALVIFEAGDGGGKPQNPASRLLFNTAFLKSSFFSGLVLRLESKRVRAGIKRVGLMEDTGVRIIKLPFPAGRLTSFSSRAVRDFIDRLRAESGAEECFMPSGASADAEYRDYRIRRDAAQIIYKAHLPYILEDIYESRGIRAGSLDTVVVAGEDRQELLQIIRRIEPYFRYITVAAPQSGDIEAELAGISAESGLTVNICSNWKTALKNADLIINLAGAQALSKYRMKLRSLLLNFNNGAGMRLDGENTVINGIDYILPADVFASLGTEVLRHFNKKELTEMVMDIRLDAYTGRTPDEDCAARVLEEFGKCGCRITGYAGRRASLKAEDVISSLRSRHAPGSG